MNEINRKCERPPGESPFTVANRGECEAKAERQGRSFLTFDEQGKQCFTSPTCDRIAGPTTVPWQIYQRSAPSALLAHTVESDLTTADACRPGVCTFEPKPAFFYHASSTSCREECDRMSTCTYFSYCPEDDPECSGTHANRCALFEKCTTEDVRSEIPGFDHAAHYLTCPHFRARQPAERRTAAAAATPRVRGAAAAHGAVSGRSA